MKRSATGVSRALQKAEQNIPRSSFRRERGSAEEPLVRFQRVVRSRLASSPLGIRLHARHLAERLQFDHALVRGVFRMLNQLAIFALLLTAVGLSGDSTSERGVYNNLEESFDFQALAGIRSRAAFMATLPPAPGWFSMITLWPRSAARPCVTVRATVSVGPPAGYGTTTLIVRSG